MSPSPDSFRSPRAAGFTPTRARGALHGPGGNRTTVVSLDFLADLKRALAPEFGDGARHLLYCTGYDWSLREMVRLGERLRDEPGGHSRDIWQQDAIFVLDAWWCMLAASGWGAGKFSALPRDLMLAEITDSAPAAAAGRTNEAACDLCAGLFAGALSFFARAECHAVEVQCSSLGHATCQFIAGASPQIDAVETWQKQNVPADEIRRRLAAPADGSA